MSEGQLKKNFLRFDSFGGGNISAHHDVVSQIGREVSVREFVEKREVISFDSCLDIDGCRFRIGDNRNVGECRAVDDRDSVAAGIDCRWDVPFRASSPAIRLKVSSSSSVPITLVAETAEWFGSSDVTSSDMRSGRRSGSVSDSPDNRV